MRMPVSFASRLASLACLALSLAVSACGGGDNTPMPDMAVCVAPQVNCGFGCSDLMTDSGNCGRCGNSCLATQHCEKGVCISDKCGTKIPCGVDEVCVDTMTDSMNCGACNNPCQPGQPCIGGKCMSACKPNEIPCGGKCVDGQRDRTNCGACGVTCRLGESCVRGACQLDICGARMLGLPGNALFYTGGPNQLAAGDLDVDGDVDLVIAGTVDVSLMLNNPNDHQLMRMALPTKVALESPLVGEWNNDLRPDLAFIDPTNKQAVVLKGDNKNNFTPLHSFAGGVGPYRLFSGQFNNDLWPDLALVSLGDGGVALALGNPMGMFKAGMPLMVPTGLRAIIAGDFNADNKTDFAYADKDGAVSLLLNLGDGTFNAPIAVTTPFPARLLAAGDFDGNMRQDLVVVGEAQSVVLFNEKNNPFPVLTAGMPGASPAKAQVVAVVDADGDKVLDLVIGRDAVGSAEGAGVTVLLSDGKQGLAAAAGVMAESNVVSLAPADFDGDGKLDIAFGQSGHDYAVGLLHGVGGGRVAAPVTTDAKARVTVMAGGDLDGDGAAELVVGTDTLNVWKNDGNGRFEKGAALDVLGFTVAAVRDVDGDKLNDVVVFDGKTTLSVFLGDGKGGLAAPVKSGAFGNYPSLTFGDLDVDGKLDLVQLGAPGALVHRGLGKGAFDAPSTFKVNHTGPALVGDFNNDGWPDLVVVDSPTSIAILINKTRAMLALPVSYPAGQNNTSITADDINNDQKLDLVLASTLPPGMGGLVSVVLNDGDGTFKAAQELGYPFSIPQVVLGDIDGDRFPDLIGPLAGPELRGLGVWRNSKGKLLPITIYPEVRGGTLPLLVDSDHDGRLDVVSAAMAPGTTDPRHLTVAITACLP